MTDSHKLRRCSFRNAHIIFNALQGIGFLIQAVNIGLGVTFFFNAQFYSNDTYYLYLMFLLLRPAIIGLITVYTIVILIPRNRQSQVETDKSVVAQKQQVGVFSKVMNVLVQPLIMYTGSVRIVSNNLHLVSYRACLVIEALSQSVPLLMIQLYNQ